ncbi:MAG: bifunctional proline dehydrogenase/L-glutamate gamma-semialdehyde dehydrogenase PutA [Stagnimonas sp.]|nr:bifunctional proline dehydrogenase/L-glutamate gamma-semialdehyde dehydrogenase PutA [Stagnimonas sp.]
MSAYVFAQPLPERDALRRAISAAYLADETALVNKLLGLAALPSEHASLVVRQAAGWVERVRRLKNEQSPLDAFMQQYDLSSEEGVLLMCLAEALLRIPDDATADKLIADKLGDADWESHFGKSDSLFVNAGTWGLMLTGKIVKLAPDTTSNFRQALNKLVAKSTEPVIQLAVRQAMRLMGSQFVMGRTINEALKNARSKAHRTYLHSYDMLGEAALTGADAERYFKAYQDAIAAIGKAVREDAVFAQAPIYGRPNISVKLSALHPRYELAKRARVLSELVPKLLALAVQAKNEGIGLTVDAEEADRLELSLDVIESVYADASLEGYEGFGLAVQAFQKRGLAVVDWLEQLARRVGRKLAVRLVKGAYWDTEVKRSQEQGLAGYPVYTRKANTDVAYLACARRLLAAREVFYPMLATHNAHTVAAVRAYAGDELGYEFQRLHGMGEALYQIVKEDLPLPCRVYSPVGSHEDLLPYLVRRLLENGANTSFVNRIFDDNTPPESLVADPVAAVRALAVKINPHLPLPAELYGAERRNSAGLFLSSEPDLQALAAQLAATTAPGHAVSLTASPAMPGETQAVTNPADRRQKLGEWTALHLTAVPALIAEARTAQPRWNAQSADARASILERAADRLEADPAVYLQLLLREAGKTLSDANAEVREAVDFLRYYAAQARRLMSTPTTLPGPTGEHNELQLHGKGVFVCISPWNFPLAIFAGQIAAALAAGNAVIAKPAEQTNLIAHAFAQLLHEAGVPRAVLQLALGDGLIGGALVGAEGIAGVAFTGSVEVAQKINRSLAAKPGPIATLIAETGGQNAMIVDSSALPEQVVKDAINSAFYSAGQRCSALRVLCVQSEIADKVAHLLAGAMQELVIGDPALLATDIGPVIDEEARSKLQAHAEVMRRDGKRIGEVLLPAGTEFGSFVSPLAVEMDSLSQLREEQFGPILHLVRFESDQLESLIEQINALGYGLTLGVHSRIERTWRTVQARAQVGNTYINRGMTGAVVGVQPFGGEGLSGTGPKAGGPHYLLRFISERTLTVNTSAVGGNARLLAASA